MQEDLGVVETAAGQSAVLSYLYLDHIDFGFVLCPEIAEARWHLADAKSSAFAELGKAAMGTAKGPTDGAGS